MENMETENKKVEITLIEAYEELTDHRHPIYKVRPLFELVTCFIGTHIIDTSKLHLQEKKIERWWQLFYALNYRSVVAYCLPKNKADRHQQAVNFFIFLTNFLEITYDDYCLWYNFIPVLQPEYHKWIKHFQKALKKSLKNKNKC